MIEPISAGTAMTGGRMILAGLKWIVHSRQAPWSAVPISATIEPYAPPWYSVRFFCRNEASFAIDLLSVRTIRPRNVPILIAEGFTPAQLVAGLKTSLIARDLKWVIQEKQAASYFQRTLLANLSGQTGEIQIDFEFKARLFDNRRTELPVWVRTNPQMLSPT